MNNIKQMVRERTARKLADMSASHHTLLTSAMDAQQRLRDTCNSDTVDLMAITEDMDHCSAQASAVLLHWGEMNEVHRSMVKPSRWTFIRTYINGLNMGSVFDRDRLLAHMDALPSIKEQRAISSILSTLRSARFLDRRGKGTFEVLSSIPDSLTLNECREMAGHRKHRTA